MTSASPVEVALYSQAEALLEKVKTLPPDEQADFAKMFQIWKTGENEHLAGDRSPDNTVQWPDFEGRMRVLFPEGPLPGDPQDTWDEMRRE